MEPTHLYLYEAQNASRPLLWAVTLGVPLLVFLTARYVPLGLLACLPAAAVPVVHRISIVLHPGVADQLRQTGATDYIFAAWLLAGGTLIGLAAGLRFQMRSAEPPPPPRTRVSPAVSVPAPGPPPGP